MLDTAHKRFTLVCPKDCTERVPAGRTIRGGGRGRAMSPAPSVPVFVIYADGNCLRLDQYSRRDHKIFIYIVSCLYLRAVPCAKLHAPNVGVSRIKSRSSSSHAENGIPKIYSKCPKTICYWRLCGQTSHASLVPAIQLLGRFTTHNYPTCVHLRWCNIIDKYCYDF